MDVTETQLPGVGERFTVSFGDGRELVVLIHNEGEQDVFWRDGDDADSERLFSLTERESRTIAEIFDGSYFEPVGEDVEEALTDATIEWVAVSEDSPVVDSTLGAAGIRSKTGATVLAIQRETETVSNPTPSTVLRAGDVLVAVGTAGAHEALETLLVGE